MTRMDLVLDDVIERLVSLLSEIDEIIATAHTAAALNDGVRERAELLIANAYAERVRLTQLISTMRAAREPTSLNPTTSMRGRGRRFGQASVGGMRFCDCSILARDRSVSFFDSRIRSCDSATRQHRTW